VIFLLPSHLSNPSFGLDRSSATKCTETKCCRTKAKQDKCYGYLHKSKLNERVHLKEREILRMVLSSVLAGVIRTTMYVLVLSGRYVEVRYGVVVWFLRNLRMKSRACTDSCSQLAINWLSLHP
jgi:hypothetical protein